MWLQINSLICFWFFELSLSDSFVELIKNSIKTKRVNRIEICCKKPSIVEDLKIMFLNFMNQFESMVSDFFKNVK